ncbi:hypothetical protein CUJ86_08825 [Methanofollis fontis]|uniref:Roadblock/LAMTOR2 domain-containing protein n=2 Tax=Methanofollis fontis TaxID=2052832 RepID=A0A483CXQ5_9EURY|nr:hypothetical protein CUJ86_08825 [Methanofollis fontis]
MLAFVLNRILAAGAIGISVTSPGGEILGEAGSRDWTGIARLIPSAAGSWGTLADSLGAENFSGALIEAGTHLLLAMPLPDGGTLAAILEPDANTGRVRYEMRKNLDLITSVL